MVKFCKGCGNVLRGYKCGCGYIDEDAKKLHKSTNREYNNWW